MRLRLMLTALAVIAATILPSAATAHLDNSRGRLLSGG